MDAPRTTIFIPCRHALCCRPCADVLMRERRPKCPNCRTALRRADDVGGPVLHSFMPV